MKFSKQYERLNRLGRDWMLSSCQNSEHLEACGLEMRYGVMIINASPN